MKIGSVIYYKNLTGFTSRLQQWVLNTKFSHCSIFYGVDQYGDPLEFEANLEVERSSYLYDPEHQDIYEWANVPDEVIQKALVRLKRKFEYTSYGVGSWLTIFIKRIFLLLGFKKAISWRIFWDKLVVCSTVIWWFRRFVTEEMVLRYSLDRGYWQTYYYDLEKYNPATYTPKEDFQLCQKHSKLFKFN